MKSVVFSCCAVIAVISGGEALAQGPTRSGALVGFTDYRDIYNLVEGKKQYQIVFAALPSKESLDAAIALMKSGVGSTTEPKLERGPKDKSLSYFFSFETSALSQTKIFEVTLVSQDITQQPDNRWWEYRFTVFKATGPDGSITSETKDYLMKLIAPVICAEEGCVPEQCKLRAYWREPQRIPEDRRLAVLQAIIVKQ